MICEHCQGTRLTKQWLSLMGGEMWAWVPCPECNGCGLGSCCQGHEGQPEQGEDE